MKCKVFIAAALMLVSGLSHAAIECVFNSGATLQIMSPGVKPNIVPRPVGTVTTPTKISDTIIMETTPMVSSSCRSGNDGDNVYMLTNYAMSSYETDGKALFGTNIPGIYFTLAFYPDGNGVTAWFPPSDGAQWVKTGDIHENESIVDGKKWHVRMEFYQTSGFTGVPKDVNFLSIGPGPVGQMVLGDPYHDSGSEEPSPFVELSQMNFDIPLDRPTCAVRGPTTVDLGDWWPQEVTSTGTTQVQFDITGNCINTTVVWLKVSSNNWTDDGQYIKNDVNGESVTKASGVGVEIRMDGNSRMTKSMNKQAIAASPEWTPISMDFDQAFHARLVKYGSDPVTPGVFGANVTFQVTYE